MPSVAVPGGEIYYEANGEGEALVFASGLNGVGSYWQPQLAVFSERFRVITYDHRGTGSSDRIQREFSVDGMADDLLALMEALAIERAHLVGLSTGGAIGQTIAIEAPQRLARLVICSTWTHCDPWFRRLFEARRELYRQAGPELHAMFHPLWLLPPEYVNAHDEQIDEERARAADSAPSVEISIGRIDALLAFDRRAGLSQITTPTLVIASDNDYITPSYHARALAAEIPNAQLEIVHGGGHSISKTMPEVFNELVMDFLTR